MKNQLFAEELEQTESKLSVEHKGLAGSESTVAEYISALQSGLLDSNSFMDCDELNKSNNNNPEGQKNENFPAGENKDEDL